MFILYGLGRLFLSILSVLTDTGGEYTHNQYMKDSSTKGNLHNTKLSKQLLKTAKYQVH